MDNLYFDRYVFDREHPIPDNLDLKGAIAFNRDENREGSLHRILFICQKIFYALFRRGADPYMTHGWVCLGRDPNNNQAIVQLEHGIFTSEETTLRKTLVAHGVFTGIKTSTRDYLNESDVTQSYLYIPRNDHVRENILKYAHQSVYNARPDKLAPEQLERVNELMEQLEDDTLQAPDRTELLKLSLISIDHNESTIVLKTQAGCTEFVKDCLYQHCGQNILHCKVDDEETILIIPRSEKQIRKIAQELKSALFQESLKFSIPDMIKSCFHVTKRAKKKKMQRTALAVADLLQGGQVKDKKGRPRSLYCTPYVMMVTQASLIIDEMRDSQKERIKTMGREEAAAKIFKWLNSDHRSLGVKFKENELWQFNFRFGMTGDAVQVLNKFSEIH